MRIIKYRLNQINSIFKYYLVLLFTLVFNIKEKNIWLISERGDEARDNGYSFYSYLKSVHPEINVKFVISKKSPDYRKISEDDIVIYKSFKHILYYITSEALISTHIQGTSPDYSVFYKLDRYHLLKNDGIQVFLQHGIIKDYIPFLSKKNNPSLDLFICGAKKEYDFLINKMGYSIDEMKYTGLSRFDNLKSKSNYQVLLMPTWRNYLSKCSDDEFLKSEFYNSYQSLINNKKLLTYLEKKNIKIYFYPHYNAQKYLKYFTSTSKNIIFASKDKFDVQKLLIQSDLLITDYSSVYFDFSYMRKPSIYFHFDYEKFRSTQYEEGYFDYIRDGFGNVCLLEKEVVDEIITCIDNDFKLDKKYLDRINNFFEYSDSNNSKRIYDEIMIKLEKRDSYER